MQVCFIAFGHQTNRTLIVEDALVIALTLYFEVVEFMCFCCG